GFIFLAADDDHITCPPNYQKECYPDWRSNITIFATVLVYAGVLNLVGSSSIISKAGSLFDWARDMPSSGKATLSNILKHINPKNLLEEIHYFSNRGRYNNSEQLPLPGQATPIERPKTLSMSELKKRVDIRIRALPNTAVFTKELHRQIINEETLYFESQKNKPLTKSEAWKHSLLRDNLSNTVSMIGPFGIAFILWGYYFLVNEYVASAIGLPNYTAAAKQLTFYSFIPFSVLVLGAGFNSANNLYNAIESLYYKKKNSDALKANQTLAARLPYSERLIPTNTTEKTELVINLFCSVLQISAFLLIAPSAGSAISLLNKYGYDNPFTINVTFWASALINGYGVSNFLNFIEPRITDFFFHNEKREMLNWNENFFKGMGELPDTKYDINKLRFAAQAG
ncbi:MAG: hypothetical protein KDH94_04655, partial [Coxiellaceae bacterium]|nr:hypothetical protein [Coxiellaceae bacterium]